MSAARNPARRALAAAKAAVEALARAANARASFLSFQRRYFAAQIFARAALGLSRVRFGRDHPVAAVMLKKLARLYAARARHAEEALYRRALAIWEGALGPEHPQVATALDDLAELFRALDRHDEAEPLDERARSIREAAFASDGGEWGRYGKATPLGGGRTCPMCGGDLNVEKDTMTGREIRSYYCAFCLWMMDEDRGPALWTIMSNDGAETGGYPDAPPTESNVAGKKGK